MLELLQWDAVACLNYHNENFGDGSTKFFWSEEDGKLWLRSEKRREEGAPKAAACPEAPPEASVKASVGAEE